MKAWFDAGFLASISWNCDSSAFLCSTSTSTASIPIHPINQSEWPAPDRMATQGFYLENRKFPSHTLILSLITSLFALIQMQQRFIKALSCSWQGKHSPVYSRRNLVTIPYIEGFIYCYSWINNKDSKISFFFNICGNVTIAQSVSSYRTWQFLYSRNGRNIILSTVECHEI